MPGSDPGLRVVESVFHSGLRREAGEVVESQGGHRLQPNPLGRITYTLS